jgi:hypothetical protein
MTPASIRATSAEYQIMSRGLYLLICMGCLAILFARIQGGLRWDGPAGSHPESEQLTMSRDPADDQDQMDAVMKVIAECPSWPYRDEEITPHLQQELRECARRLSAHDLDLLQLAFSRYADVDPNKLYVLARYLFDVPRGTHDDVPMFASFAGSRRGLRRNLTPPAVSHQGYVPLWPLGFNMNGDLVLLEQPGLYSGPPYGALEEFVYFRERFGRRTGRW